MRFRRLLFPALFVSGLFLPLAARATPYWGPAEVERYYHPRVPGHPGGAPPAPMVPGAGSILRHVPQYNQAYLDFMIKTVHFLSIMQEDSAGPNFGGIHEGEALMNIIQTDNTSEAIWLWSRYYELTGDNTYHQNILNAFTYELNHPAYNEEGGSLPTSGYYRIYNSGWAVRAEEKYRDVYHDQTYKTYGDSCGSYLRYHTLWRSGSQFNKYVNPPVLAWGAGNLYNAGVHEGIQAWKDYAVQETRDSVKVWCQQEPALLGDQTWAMAGGAIMWGMINSYLAANPDSLVPWVNRFKGDMVAFADSGAYQNAWNGWYAYGHRAAGKAVNDSLQLALHVVLTDTLMSYDGDHDGGIPVKPADTNQMDQTWVSSYLNIFGLSELLDELTAVPEPGAGAPRLVLLQGGPNPFGGSTSLTLDLLRPSNLDLGVFDAGGRRIVSLANGHWSAGRHRFLWDGTGAGGTRVAPGVYWAALRSENGGASQRLVLLR